MYVHESVCICADLSSHTLLSDILLFIKVIFQRDEINLAKTSEKNKNTPQFPVSRQDTLKEPTPILTFHSTVQ